MFIELDTEKDTSMANSNLLLLLSCLALSLTSTVEILPRYLPSPEGSLRDDLVEQYFHLGLSYTEILFFLAAVHGVHLCLRQLKRILKKHGLRRRGNRTDYGEVIRCVEGELRRSGSNLGYRMMHQRLNNEYGCAVDRESVRIILKALDPEGVEARKGHRLKRRKYRAKGPNFIWHLDGYDKLKPFGFCIHGAIDGYSRRVLWLEVASTNNDPKVIAQYFMDYIRTVGVPYIVRGDYGTENVNVAAIQRFLRRDCDDALAGEKSFMYGRSVSNQRIEAWWSILRKCNSDWWINFFKDIRDTGLYNDADPIQVECLRFCFLGILQKELQLVQKEWNLHRIRPSTNNESPPGRPDVLYFIPEGTNTRDYAVPVDEDDVGIAAEMLCADVDNTYVSTFLELAKIIMEENRLCMPDSPEGAKRLYIDLLADINRIRS